MRFSDIPGHDDVKARLINLVDNNRIPHALLLEGPAGAGQFALARATAQYIHCVNKIVGHDSCGECPACKQHQSFNHIDTIYSFPVVKKGSPGIAISDDYMPDFTAFLDESPFMDFEIWLARLENINAQPQIYVEEANELIRKLSFTSHGSGYKIVLMWLPERLKEESANKLLKLIEEPFSDTIFIMASDNSRLILPTIYSRTQRIPVIRYSDKEVADFLCAEYSLERSDAEQIAPLAAGNITNAINLIGVSKERDTYLKLFMELMRKAYARNVGDLKEWANELALLGREREMNFWDYSARLIRENFILNLHTQGLNALTESELQFCTRFSPFINERNVLKLFDVINNARADIAANGNAKIINFDVAIKVILLLKS